MKALACAVLLVIALPVTAADLPAWMSGTWRGESGGVRTEEHWSEPDGGLMLGLHRDVSAKRTFFEFLRIVREGDTLVFLAMPGGRPATSFPLKSAEANRIVFENLGHDFPQRIIYWRDGEKLCARVEGKGSDAEEWCWTRVR